MKNNVWKKFLAGLSAAAILVTSLGVMPIVSADESAPAGITETKLIEKITFDGYGESVSGQIDYNLTDPAPSARAYFFNSEGHRLDAKAVFKAQANVSTKENDPIANNGKKFFYGGTVTTSLPERAEGNRYFGGGTLTYKAVTFVDADGDGTVDRQEADTTSSSNSVVYSLDSGTGKNPIYGNNAKIEAGEQIVYEVAVSPSLGKFSISPRPNSDYLTNADPKYVKGGLYKLFEVKNDNILYFYDVYWDSAAATPAMKNVELGKVTLPKTSNDWYDLKVVYTCTEDGSHEKVYAYVDGVCLYRGDMTSRVHAKTPGRVDFEGKFDDFAITKYDGIKYDGINATTVVAKQDFNSFATSTIKAGETISHFDGIITGNGTSKDHIVTISSKPDDQNDKYIDGVEYAGETQFFGNTSANRNLSKGGLIAGEQMVFNFSTRSDKKFYMYVRAYGAAREVDDYWDSDKSTTKKNTFKWGDGCIYLWTIENGKLYIHPGHLENTSASNAIAYIDLPASSWVDIKAVYTAYADHTSAAFYINGKLALPMLKDGTDIASATGELSLPTNISYTYKTDAEGTEKTIGPFPVMPFTKANGTAGSINRFNITDKAFTLDNFEVTRYDGIKFDPADAIEHHISSGTPQEKEVLNIMTFDDTELWVDQAPTKDDNYYNGLIFMKSGAKVTMVQDGAGDQSAKFTTSSDTPWINPKGTNTGIIDGEQFVVSLDAHTATDLKFSPIIFQGYKSNVNNSRVKIETLFKIDKGKLVHSNGGGIANAWAGVGDYKNNHFSYDLPADSWVNLYLVYTKKAVGMDVDIYVDGELVKSESLPYNYLLNGPIQRIHTETGHIDNLCIKTYRFGAEFDPNSIPKKEEEELFKTLVSKMTFDNGTAFSKAYTESTSQHQPVDDTSAPGHKIRYSNNFPSYTNGETKTYYGGTMETILGDRGEGNKYYAGHKFTYDEGEETKVKNNSQEIWYQGNSDNPALADFAFDAGEQVVFNFAANPSLGFGLSLRPTTAGIYTLVNISSKGLTLVDPLKDDGAKTLKTVRFPDGANAWYNIRLVYTAHEDGSNTADVYINDVCYIKDATLTNPISGFTFNGGRIIFSKAFDDFEVIKYPSIEYDASEATMNTGFTTVLYSANFNGEPYSTTYADVENYPDHIFYKEHTKEVDGNTVADNNATSAWGDFSSMKNLAEIKIVEDAPGDYSLDITNTNGGDRVWVTGLLKDSTKNLGLMEDEQMVLSVKLHTSKEYKGLTGLMYTGGGKRLVIPTLTYKDGVLHVKNGGAITGFDYATVNPVGSADAVAVNVLTNSWIDVTLVYNKKASTSTVDVYINGEYVKSGELAATYLLDGHADRFMQNDGHIDDLVFTKYFGGAKFDASKLAKSEYCAVYTDSTLLNYSNLESVKDLNDVNLATEYNNGNPFERKGLTFDADLDGVYGKASGDKVLRITKATVPATYEGDYDLTAANTNVEEGYTITNITKRISLLNTDLFGRMDSAKPVFVSFDFLADETFSVLSIAGRVIGDDNANNGGTYVQRLIKSGDRIYIQEKPADYVDIEGANFGFKEWHNIAMQFVPGEEKYTLYVDGQAFKLDIPGPATKYNGLGMLYMDISGSALFDNITIKTGICAPVQRGTVDLAFAGNDDAWSRGFAWDAENKCITSDKKAGLTIPYNDVVANFTNGTLLAADGTVAVADGQVDQIAITDANGYIHYFKIKPRTGTKFEPIGGGSYVLDVADGSNYGVADVNMFIVEYDGDTISNVIVVNPSDANIIGDTLYFDDVEIPEGASMFIFDNDNLRPLK